MPNIRLTARELASLSPQVRAELEKLKPATKGKRKAAVELLPSFTTVKPDGTVVIQVGVETRNESNQRQWRVRNQRAGAAWRSVRAAADLRVLAPIAEHAKRGGVVRVKFVRVGGGRLDALCNLPASLKAVEDSVCYLLGIDDGSPRWVPTCDQEPGSGPVGVRVEVRGEGEYP